ncbi:MAG: class I SAM-dependent methyltransferase [Candidatus Bathyarchaeia archaeon]|jgi:SAM-dependent methyltransferase
MWRSVLIGTVKNRLAELEGDILEIGCCRGELTVALAKLAEPLGKKVYAVDVCDVDFDKSTNDRGLYLPTYYAGLGLNSENQEQILREAIAPYSNVVFNRVDSAKMRFPKTQRFCFAVIDGCHTPEYVHGDFKRAWRLLTSGGLVAMHDYRGDMHVVTESIDQLLEEYAAEIAAVAPLAGWWVVIEKKVMVTKDGA